MGSTQMDFVLEDGLYGWYKATMGGITFCLREHESAEAAHMTSYKLSKLPCDYFLRTKMVFCHQNKHYVAYERFEESLGQYIKGANLGKKKCLVRNIIAMSIELERLGILHCNLHKKNFVVVDGNIKCFDIPISGIKEARDQARQILDLVKFVTSQIKKDAVQKDFLEKLQTAFSGNDLKSCLYHPYLGGSYSEKVFYHASCMATLLGVDNDTRSKFYARSKFDTNDSDWRNRLNRVGSEEMKKVYNHVEGGAYDISTYDKHRFIRNYCQHTDKTNVYVIGEELEQVFPDYLLELHDYMHVYDQHQFIDKKIEQGDTLIKNLERGLSQLFGNEGLQFDSAIFLRSFDIFDFVLAKLYCQCLLGNSGITIGREIRADIIGHLDALNNIEELDGKTFEKIINGLDRRMKDSLHVLIKYANALVKWFSYSISDSTATTIEMENLVDYFPWTDKFKETVKSQVKHLPKRSKLRNILEPVTLSDESIMTNLDSLMFDEILEKFL